MYLFVETTKFIDTNKHMSNKSEKEKRRFSTANR